MVLTVPILQIWKMRLEEVKPKVLTDSFNLQTLLVIHEDAQVLQQLYGPRGSSAHRWGPLVQGVEGMRRDSRMSGSTGHFLGECRSVGAGLREAGECFHPS